MTATYLRLKKRRLAKFILESLAREFAAYQMTILMTGQGFNR